MKTNKYNTKVVPAIDILHGQVVRLFQGDFDNATYYFHDPVAVAQKFGTLGYTYLHLVDLIGAKTGEPQILNIIKKLKYIGVDIQVGGGIRSMETAKKYLSAGVKRIIIGTQALIEPTFVDELLKEFSSDAIVVSLDIRHGKLALNGWTREVCLPIDNVLLHLQDLGVKHIIVTDITKDGTLSGFDRWLYKPLIDSFSKINFYAAGGICSKFDIMALGRMGIAGVIVGKAFYEQGEELMLC